MNEKARERKIRNKKEGKRKGKKMRILLRIKGHLG